MRYINLFVLIFFFLFVGCVNDSTESSNSGKQGSDVLVEPDQDDLDFSNTGNNIFPESQSSIVSKAANSDIQTVNGNATTLSLKKFFTLNPLEIGNKTTQATDVVYNDGYIFISYATVGSSYGGGVQIIKIDSSVDYASLTSEEVQNSVTITDQWVSSNVDITMLEVHGSKVYAVGAVDLSSANYSSLESSAMLFSIDLSGGTFNKNNGVIKYNYYPLTSYVGKDIACSGDRIYVVTGDAGYLEVYQINNGLTKLNEEPIRDARSVKVHNGAVYVMSASGVSIYNVDGELQSSFIDFPNGAIDDFEGAQRILSVKDNCVLVPQGIYGVSAYELSSNSELFHLQPASSYADNSNYEIAVNSALMISYEEQQYLLVATGEAGLAEATISSDNKEARYECVFDLDGTDNSSESANMVTSFEVGTSTFVAVATGNDGLHLLRVDNGNTEEEETDEDLEIDENADYEIYNWSMDLSNLEGKTRYVTSSYTVWFSKIANGTLVWRGDLGIQNANDV
ncbi:MAG: hypothetical protein ACK5IJ_04440, partial [Mangrovibacterium sp.]